MFQKFFSKLLTAATPSEWSREFMWWLDGGSTVEIKLKLYSTFTYHGSCIILVVWPSRNILNHPPWHPIKGWPDPRTVLICSSHLYLVFLRTCNLLVSYFKATLCGHISSPTTSWNLHRGISLSKSSADQVVKWMIFLGLFSPEGAPSQNISNVTLHTGPISSTVPRSWGNKLILLVQVTQGVNLVFLS